MEFKLSAFADEAGSLLIDQIAALRDNGIPMIELRGVDGKSCADLTAAEAGDVRRRLDDAGITLSALGSPFGKYSIEADFAPHMEVFRRGLENCAILGADRIRMFSFFMPSDKDPALFRGAVMDRLGQMLDAAQACGIRLCHENEKGIYGDTDDRCLDLMQVHGDRMGFIFDPANFIQCGVTPVSAMEKLLPYVTYMHIKDALMADGSVVPAGCGDADMQRLLTMVSTLPGPITLTIEPHLSVFSGLAQLQNEQLLHRYAYATQREAFNAAVSALRGILSAL